MSVKIRNPFAPATVAQASMIADLMGCPAEQREAYINTITSNRTMGEASARIGELLDAAREARKSAPKPSVTVERGEWHYLSGTFYLVARAQGSGRLYVKARNMTHGGFDRAASGTLYRLGEATRVNASHAEEIRRFASMHDACIFCNLPIDTPESRAAGYGEKCASNNGLPYGNL